MERIRGKYSFWTDEVLDFMRSCCPLPEHGFAKRQDFLNILNQKFGTTFTIPSLSWAAKRYNIPLGFSNGGHVRGAKHLAYHPVGSFRCKKQYLQIKIGEPSVWMQYNRYVWEKHTGKSSKGLVIIFLDGNTNNFSIENLEAVTRRELVVLNKVFKTFYSAEERKIQILQVRIRLATLDLVGSELYLKDFRRRWYLKKMKDPVWRERKKSRDTERRLKLKQERKLERR